MLLKYSAAIAAFALYGHVRAGPCKPATHLTTSSLEASSTLSTETSSATTTSETFVVMTETSAITFSSEVSTTTTDASTFLTLTTESATLDATTTEFISTSTATSDVSTTETATTSAAPVCTFTGEYTNYVQNPSFDALDANQQSTVDPWIILGAPTVTTNLPRTGAHAVAYTYPFSGLSSGILQSLTGVVAGQEYVLRYHWVLTAGQPLQEDYCRIGTSAGSGGQNIQYVYVDGTQEIVQGQYYAQEYRITAEQDNQRLSIGFFCTGQPSAQVNIQLDDISVYDYYEGCETPSD
ncbi:hypothetical protein FBEOM_2489 [Fusarium beomiforme]|uniref:CBM-cenC domain-containing protein n=1 Tax=Fusarium beomiforme TaxID=44412 RepID=A0A9P5ARG8_9HYPO|nr:hypothetical protein FBEOM_2489 [Fusarium beomiforme]